jgi:hypothetical protein
MKKDEYPRSKEADKAQNANKTCHWKLLCYFPVRARQATVSHSPLCGEFRVTEHLSDSGVKHGYEHQRQPEKRQ